MDLFAHLTNRDNKRIEQTLEEHCMNVAEYAAKSIGSTGIYHTAYLAGILHDAGKAKSEFVEYIEKAYQGEKVIRGSVNHTFAGVIWLFEKYHMTESSVWERMTCEIIGYAVGSHHGIFDCVDLDGENGFQHRLKKDKKELFYEETLHNYFENVMSEDALDELFQKAVHEIQPFFQKAMEVFDKKKDEVFFQISMLVRLVLSAVIYGDRRDTSEFMGQLIKNGELKADWRSQREYFEKRIKQFDKATALNAVRDEISRQCADAAQRPSGIYRLNVPTGGGKTLCTLRYALAHAEKYNKKRIIFIIPLLSVLDQNVKVIKEFILDEKEVLEHHSNVIKSLDMNGEELDHYEYLSDSWNYPIIVSTLVQLLNILFSQQTSAIGRMQALCDSVIVIDEVQSLPKKITVMFNMAMNFLHQVCNAAIVLSSATQPCFEDLRWPLHLTENPDLVRLTKEQLQVFKRADVIDQTDSYGMDWEECAAFCEEAVYQHDSLLVVCNTKAEARTLFEKLKERAENTWDIYHLSTSMCQEHRWDILERLKESLRKVRKNADKRKAVCISTQLIEAGVDISFECVVRVMAGLDNLAQTAGRCNRSNEYGHAGKVYLINLKNENLSMLQEIKKAQDSTRKVLNIWKDGGGDILEEQAVRRFYQFLFKETETEIKYPIKDYGNTIYLADLLSNRNNHANNSRNENYILYQPFKTIGKSFKIFDQDTTDILVPYGKGADIAEQLRIMKEGCFELERLRPIMQQAKKFTISIFEWQKKKLYQAGMLYPILDGRVMVLDKGAYDDCFGLIVTDGQAAENFIL